MKRRNYPRDPYWIEARFPGKCCGNRGECPQPIKKGDRAFYYPNGRRGRNIFAVPCGHAEENARDFSGCLFDETQGRMS